MNKKTKVVVYTSLLILLGALIGYLVFSYVKSNSEDNNLLSEIQNSYHSTVKTTKKKSIYLKVADTYQKIGTIETGVILSLDQVLIDDTSDIYFPIVDSEYYIDYLNLEKAEEIVHDTSLNSYVVTKTAKTNPTSLYQDGTLKWQLEQSLEFDIKAKQGEWYYVTFLGQVYQLKDDIDIIEKEADIPLLEKISVLNFDEHVTTSQLNEIFHHLQEQGYRTLGVTDFKLWILGNIQLPDKSVLLLTYGDWTEEKEKLASTYSFIVNTNFDTVSFTSGDQQLKVGDTTYYKYEINSTTSFSRVQQMLKGIAEVKIEPISSVAVLNYHFFYDSSSEACNESICISTAKFREQLNYLKKEGYKTLTMNEFNDWMDGKLTIPKKSVLITIDDGAAGTYTHLPQILEEYQMHATLFLISGWWPVERYRTSYLEVQSHGHNLHDSNYCDGNGCGYKPLKLSKEELKMDLQNSISTVGTSLAFCYPFYQTNATLVEAVRESGFQLGFVGGNKKVTRKNNKYYIPRHVIYKNTSLAQFIQMVSS